MRLMHSRAIYNASGHKSVFPLSFANFISGHKALSMISLALLVAVSGWALWLGSQNTGASGNNTRKAASVEVNSTSQPATSSAAQVPASNNSSSTTVNTSTTQSGSGGSTQVNVNGQ